MLDNMPRGTICIEDIEIGMTRHLRKTVTDRDIEMFAEISTDRNPVHLDDAYAQDTIFQGRIAHGMLTAGLISAVIGVACQLAIPNTVLAGGAAVGLALFAMHALRCIHPPGGATALTAVIGGSAVHALVVERDPWIARATRHLAHLKLQFAIGDVDRLQSRDGEIARVAGQRNEIVQGDITVRSAIAAGGRRGSRCWWRNSSTTWPPASRPNGSATSLPSVRMGRGLLPPRYTPLWICW